MALADAAAQEEPPRIDYHSRGCALGNFARTLPATEREALTALLAKWPAGAISRWLATDEDYRVKISAQVIRRHRTGACSCGPL